MESARHAPPPNLGTVARAFTKILRLRRAGAAPGGGGGGGGGVAPDDDDDAIEKLKLSAKLSEAPIESFFMPEPEKLLFPQHKQKQKQKQQQQKAAFSEQEEAAEALLASVFASVSAVKAAYAELQLAQSPYDPDAIESADRAVVAELKRLSELKQCFFKKQLPPPPLALPAQVEEQRHVLRTYQITARKLESEIALRDAEVLSARDDLRGAEQRVRALEARLRPGRSLAALDDLHLSGLNPPTSSPRSAAPSNPCAPSPNPWRARWSPRGGTSPPPPRRAPAAARSLRTRRIGDEVGTDWSRRRFFDEFTELKSARAKHFLDAGTPRSPLGRFYRAKYLTLVHPKMESSFFGDLDQRALVSLGRGFPDTPWFAAFAEAARRVWLLHCLFFAFEGEGEGEGEGEEGKVTERDRIIFQARRGERFSEVYMESVAENDNGSGGGGGGTSPIVGFTVVPGFRVGRTLIQCMVYLASGDGRS
uniref:Uncharacterized protein n=1 Tax=Ananas comosus var. bracteatus TaxID=296719 RepID=A0A6V7QJV5_ANACO|nr:unnamed protein product [Ananas comosus var. bracteatus]